MTIRIAGNLERVTGKKKKLGQINKITCLKHDKTTVGYFLSGF